jgi:hypothetical protein
MSAYSYIPIHEYDVTEHAVSSYIQKKESIKDIASQKTVFLGFDGYVDLIYSLVASRDSPEVWTRMKSMKEFGSRVLNAAGSSCNIERVLKKDIAGGFAPNMARAFEHLGSKAILAGAMGKPEIKPIFTQFGEKVRLISIQNNGTTICLEFDDGKVMTTDFGSINTLTWGKILETIPRDDFIDLIEDSDALGFGHWALIPNMNNFWEKMIQEIFPSVTSTKSKYFMVDTADITKRSDKDILKMLNMLHGIETFMPTILSMNDRETIDLSKVLSRNSNKYNGEILQPIERREDFYDIGKRMNELLDLSFITSHDPHFTTITTRKNHYWVTEGFTLHPKFTTAAGDHYNTGVLLGMICDLKPYESLVLGNAVTAVFVRTGQSPTISQVNSFISNYFHYIEEDDDSFPLS